MAVLEPAWSGRGMLYTIELVSSIFLCPPEMQAAFAGRGCLQRLPFMRTAILSVILAVMATGAPQQDPAKPDSHPSERREKSAERPLSVLCAPRTTIQLGVAYDSAVVASGGTGAYQFAIIGGALPPGVRLNPSRGTVFGTPTADGPFSYTVQVTDSAGAMATTGSTPCTLQPGSGISASGAPAADSAAKPPAQGGPPSRPDRKRGVGGEGGDVGGGGVSSQKK